MLVHVVGPVAHRTLQTLVPDTTHLHWNLLVTLLLKILLKIPEWFLLGSSVSTQYYCCDLQSKKRASSPRHCSSAGGQEAHSNRQGPSGLHSQNLLQSATQHTAYGDSFTHKRGTRTVLVDVVVGGLVVEVVLAAVGDQAPVELDAVRVVWRHGAHRQPVVLVAVHLVTLHTTHFYFLNFERRN